MNRSLEEEGRTRGGEGLQALLPTPYFKYLESSLVGDAATRNTFLGRTQTHPTFQHTHAFQSKDFFSSVFSPRAVSAFLFFPPSPFRRNPPSNLHTAKDNIHGEPFSPLHAYKMCSCVQHSVIA